MSTQPSRHRRIRLIVSAVALAVFSVTGITASWAISGGEDAPEGKFGFAVLIDAPAIPNPDGTTRASACSGVLISPVWVATAGHCFHDASAERNRVSGAPRYPATATAGRSTITGPGGETTDVVDVRQHSTVDFALVRLAAPIVDAAPIELSKEVPVPGATVRMTGWGSANSSADLTQRPDRLQTGLWTIARVEADTVLVTGQAPSNQTSACPFDSGAPYFTEDAQGTARLVATEIVGPDCPHAGEETTARVDVLIPWIVEQDPELAARILPQPQP
jgi:V8-like Glu-specific endopeptidase